MAVSVLGVPRFPYDFLIVTLDCFETPWSPKSSPPNGFRAPQNDISLHVRFCYYLLHFRTILTIPKGSQSDMNSIKNLLLNLSSTRAALLLILTSKLEPKRWGHSVPFPLGAPPCHLLHSWLHFYMWNCMFLAPLEGCVAHIWATDADSFCCQYSIAACGYIWHPDRGSETLKRQHLLTALPNVGEAAKYCDELHLDRFVYIKWTIRWYECSISLSENAWKAFFSTATVVNFTSRTAQKYHQQLPKQQSKQYSKLRYWISKLRLWKCDSGIPTMQASR